MLTVKKHIAGCLYEKYTGLAAAPALSASDFEGFLEYPPDEKLGDLAFPCFKLSRELKMAPPAIAAKLCDNLGDDIIDRAVTAGGYINFYISPDYLAGKLLPEITTKGANYGSFDFGKGKTVVLDYSSPNVAKPFHIGHLGTTVIGHALKMLHSFAGYHCVGINHLGDWGTQFGKMIVAYRKWGSIPSGCGSGWGLPRRSWKTPGCWCWTSRLTDWTNGAHRMCAICWMSCEAEEGQS